MGHTSTHVEPVKIQQPYLLCFCDGIYLQKVQERNFCFLSSTIRLRRQAYLFHYGSLRRSSFFLDVTQRVLVVSNQRFRATYRSHLQWPSSLFATLVLLKFPSLANSPNLLNTPFPNITQTKFLSGKVRCQPVI